MTLSGFKLIKERAEKTGPTYAVDVNRFPLYIKFIIINSGVGIVNDVFALIGCLL